MKHLNTDRLYESEELAKKALRRAKWNENRNGWSRSVKRVYPRKEILIEIARIVLFEGKHKISVETVSKSDFLSWS